MLPLVLADVKNRRGKLAFPQAGGPEAQERRKGEEEGVKVGSGPRAWGSSDSLHGTTR